MANDAANSITIQLGSTTTATLAKIRDVSFDETSNEIDLTTVDSSQHVFASGIPNVEVTVEVLGIYTTKGRGDTTKLVINYNDSGSATDSIATALITGRSVTGSLDGEYATSLTFVPSV